MGMDDADANPHSVQYHGRPLASLSRDNLLVLDRQALRATVKARYYSERGAEGDDGTATTSTRLEGDEDGRFTVASASTSASASCKPTRATHSQAPPAKPKQRRIKSAAPRFQSNATASQLSHRLSSKQGSQHSLTSGSSNVTISDSSTFVTDNDPHCRKSARRNLSGSTLGARSAAHTASPGSATSDGVRKRLLSNSVQCAAMANSRHLAKTERPHSSYTRPSSAVNRARQGQLRRRSVSEPSQLHIDVADVTPLLQHASHRTGAAPPSQGTPGHDRGTSRAVPRPRPHSAMPRLQQTPTPQRPHSAQFQPVYRTTGSGQTSTTELSVTGRQLAAPPAAPPSRAWPGLLEEVDEDALAQREQEEEELALLLETDPAAAREQELRKTLLVHKLETPERPPPSTGWRSGRIAIPEFHCDRCRDFWLRHGQLPDGCAGKRRSISGFNWSRRPSDSGKRGASAGKLVMNEGAIVPVNSMVSVATGGDIAEEDEGDGAGGDGYQRRLSTIAGSEVGDLLRSGTSSRSNVSGDGSNSAGGDSSSARRGLGSGDEASGLANGDPRSFIGADGKVYLPDDDLGDYKPQEIPAQAVKGKSGRRGSAKRRKSKRAQSARGNLNSRTSDDEQGTEKGQDEYIDLFLAGLNSESEGDDDDAGKSKEGTSTQSTRTVSGVSASANTSTSAGAAAAPTSSKRSSKANGKEQLTLENIQDLFTRAFTFTYYVPSKASRDEVTSWRSKSSKK